MKHAIEIDSDDVIRLYRAGDRRLALAEERVVIAAAHRLFAGGEHFSAPALMARYTSLTAVTGRA